MFDYVEDKEFVKCKDYEDCRFINEALHSAGIQEKAKFIRKKGKWQLVRSQYLNIKNRYLLIQSKLNLPKS